jgi:MFS family permease
VIPVPFFAGWVADRWGARLVLAGGMLIAALGLLGAAASGTLWHWYATAGVLGTEPDVLGKQHGL